MDNEKPSRLELEKQKLIEANMKGDEGKVKEVFDMVLGIYGLNFAQQWRTLVLEEHGRRRTENSLKDALSFGLED